jgi:hypothetical protein
MNKIQSFLIVISLTFTVVSQGLSASCPDGSEPIKSVSEDGTYFVYNCGTSNSNSNSNAGAVKVSVQESTSSGNWFPTDGLPMYSPLC